MRVRVVSEGRSICIYFVQSRNIFCAAAGWKHAKTRETNTRCLRYLPGRGGKITDTSLLLTSSPLPITHLLQAVPTLRGLTGVSYVALKSFHHSFQPSEQTAVKYKYNLTCWWHLEPRQKATVHQNQLEEQSTQGCRVREVDLKLLQFKGKNITNQICFYTVLITLEVKTPHSEGRHANV